MTNMRARKVRGRQAAVEPGSRAYIAYEYVMLAAGALLMALSFNLFLTPHRLASGGVAGISILLRHTVGWEPAYVQWAMNVPLFLLGWKLLGESATWKTAAGTVLLPLFVYVTREIGTPTGDPLLASIFGGVLTGAGLGIVFRSRGTTGGLSIMAKILHKYVGLSYGLATALLDGLVIAAAGFVFAPELALYALLSLFITSKTIDVVQLGWSASKVAFVISRKTEALERAILYELDRGVTRIPAYGAYTGAERPVLMVVIGTTEVARLKEKVRQIDPSSFVLISDAHEVLGEGFRRNID